MTIEVLRSHLAAIDAYEAEAKTQGAVEHPARQAARNGARRILNESIAALQAGLPDPHADARAAGEAGRARGPNRPAPPLIGKQSTT
jgi:hypothetical protein